MIMERQAKLCMLLLLLSFVSYSMGRQQQLQGWMQRSVKDEEKGCKYVVKIQTSETAYNLPGNHQIAISLCWDYSRCHMVVDDLRKYGDRGPNYAHYFDKGAYSTFEINTRDWCYDTCQIILTHLSQEAGGCPSWSVDTVQVQALNTYGYKKFDEFFPIYGTIKPGDSATVSKCPIALKDGKTLDVQVPGITPLFTFS